MTSCRHHSGYLADDEGGHPPHLARVNVPIGPHSEVPIVFLTSSGALNHSPSFSFPVGFLSGPQSDYLTSLTTPLTLCWALVILSFIPCVPLISSGLRGAW